MAQTEAVIKSTGGAAGLTAEQISDMAAALSSQSTFSDDAIQKGQNLLLTFTGIGADVFPMATQAMLDMATAMGTDASSGAIQLGKALNDPTEGISALTRVGVVFTDEQKNLIKSLQDAGDMAGAQKVILAELNKEFGGSAAAQVETYAGQMKQLQNNMDNLAETVGGALLPTLTAAAGALNLIFTWNGKVKNALQAHADQLVQTSKTYDEYRNKMLLANEAAGEFHQETVRTTGAGRGFYTVTRQVVDTTNILSAAEWEASRSTDALNQTISQGINVTDGWVTKLLTSVPAMETVAQKQESLNAGMNGLKTILSGPMAAENEKYYASQKDAGQAMADVKTELDKLTASNEVSVTTTTAAKYSQAEYELALQKSAQAAQALTENTNPDKQLALQVAAEKAAAAADKMAGGLGGATSATIDNSTKIGELQTKYDALKATYKANADAHKAATARIVFDLLQQKVLADGVQDGDVAFLAKMGEAWGIYDQATATAMQAVETAVTEHGTNAMAVLDDLSGKVMGLPNVDRYITYHMSSTGNLPSAAAGDSGLVDTGKVTYGPDQPVTPVKGALAGGGDAFAGMPYLVGERGPELVIPRQAATVIPADQTARMLGGGVTIIVNATVSNNTDIEYLANRVVRRIQAQGALA